MGSTAYPKLEDRVPGCNGGYLVLSFQLLQRGDGCPIASQPGVGTMVFQVIRLVPSTMAVATPSWSAASYKCCGVRPYRKNIDWKHFVRRKDSLTHENQERHDGSPGLWQNSSPLRVPQAEPLVMTPSVRWRVRPKRSGRLSAGKWNPLQRRRLPGLRLFPEVHFNWSNFCIHRLLLNKSVPQVMFAFIREDNDDDLPFTQLLGHSQGSTASRARGNAYEKPLFGG